MRTEVVIVKRFHFTLEKQSSSHGGLFWSMKQTYDLLMLFMPLHLANCLEDCRPEFTC
jgi:hypothetical protein